MIEEGLPGRTTVHPDPVEGECTRTASRVLPAILESHLPIDLVVLMLGTNDLKHALPGAAGARSPIRSSAAACTIRHS